VEAGGARLLFDAGISARRAAQRLAARGRSILGLDALIVSHDHADHVACAGIYHRKFKLPVYVSEPTYRAAAERHSLGPIGDVRHFASGGVLRFHGAAVQTIPTPHDGVDGVAFVIDDGRSRLGILTDLGHVFDGLADVIASLDAVILESNHDPQMLAEGTYPDWLKRRVAGPGGHISNPESAELLRDAGDALKWACLAHLSQENNDPYLALDTHRAIAGGKLTLPVASRHDATDVLHL
jgi:phosphoribosyl 1,2-cyclic phosphodiesterase